MSGRAALVSHSPCALCSKALINRAAEWGRLPCDSGADGPPVGAGILCPTQSMSVATCQPLQDADNRYRPVTYKTQKAWSVAWTGSDRRDRLPRNWYALRREVMALHGAVCHVCGMTGSDAIDHLRAGDDHSVANLAPIHQDVPPYCHREKSAHEGVAARARLRAQRTRPPERHPGMRED